MPDYIIKAEGVPRPYDRLTPAEQMALDEAWRVFLWKLSQWRDNRGPVKINTATPTAERARDVLANAIMEAREPLPPENKVGLGRPQRVLTQAEMDLLAENFGGFIGPAPPSYSSKVGYPRRENESGVVVDFPAVAVSKPRPKFRVSFFIWSSEAQHKGRTLENVRR